MTNKISLCVIAGNVERHIGRFLDHFQGVADEVIVVRAIGNQEPDGTLAISAHRGCRSGEYTNDQFKAKREGNKGTIKDSSQWPHVDDFAAARNKACDMATGDWLMWADTDDVITPDSIAQIKALLPQIPDHVDGVLMRYVIPEDGVINWRERIWRKGSARWENPIHECLKFRDGANHMRFEGAEIVHASEKRSASRDERNLRILESIPEDKRTISQHFHVFQSLIALDRDAEAIPKAIEFVGMEGVGKNERYEALFQLARLAGDPAEKHAMLLQAVATDPTRREAYGELGLACVPHDAPAALGWTTAMGALSIAQEAPWNLRRSYYGQLGVHLHGMALRVNNRKEEADTMEANHFIRNGAKISLLHATRGRPAKAWRCRMDWLRAASNPDAIEHIFGIDADDASSFMLTATRHVVSWPNEGPIGAWNAAAKASSGQILVQLSDDWEPFPGWDLAILEAVGDTSKPAVLAVSDGHRKDDLLCMAILTRARYKQQGYLFHPEFFSMFSDNWFSRQAFADGVVIDARDRITFEHVHPAFGKAEMDATYARSNDSYHYATGEGIFRRLCEGIKVSADIDGWFDFRDVYDHVATTLDDADTFVEVGSWKGKSAVYLAHRLRDIGKQPRIICVDTFEGDAETGKGSIIQDFDCNRASSQSSPILTREIGESLKISNMIYNGEMAGVFIDASHDYESVKADIAAWLPKVKPGGFFGGHDIDAPGVLQAVTEAGFEWEKVGRCWIKKP
jgi:glycosyltransferase involved in cell wall biosynthesis